MTATISVRLEGKQTATNQKNHDTRTGKQPAYVDSSKSHHNSILITPKTTSELRQMCEKARFEFGNKKRKMKSNAHIVKTGIITFGVTAQKIMALFSEHEQNKIFNNVSAAVSEHCKTEITGLVVHRDESALHAHFQMPAINKHGQPISKSSIDYAALQDIAGKEVAEYGISRGKKKSERMKDKEIDSKHIHRTVKELHDDLPGELAQKKKEISAEIKRHANIRELPKPKNVELRTYRKGVLGKKSIIEAHQVYLPEDIYPVLEKASGIINLSAVHEEQLRIITSENKTLRTKNTTLTTDIKERDSILKLLTEQRSLIENEMTSKGVDYGALINNLRIKKEHNQKQTLGKNLNNEQEL